MRSFRIAILYGSQTGNAQSIAEGVHANCKDREVDSKLLPCNGWKKMEPELKEWSAVVFVVSTTGNGDAPENTERFWRFLKRRTQPKDLLENLPFALLGLGDTNYDKFCHMGKSIERRLRELGAKPFHRSAFADEATNMEETVEPWLAELYPAMDKLRSSLRVGVAPVSDDGADASREQDCLEALVCDSATGEETIRGDAPEVNSGGTTEDTKKQVVLPRPTEDSNAPMPSANSNRMDVNGNPPDHGSSSSAEIAIAVQVATDKNLDDDSAQSNIRHSVQLPSLAGAKQEEMAATQAQGQVDDEGCIEIERIEDMTAKLEEIVPAPEGETKLPPHRVAILFGSQTGNAQSIAESILEGCKQRDIESVLTPCDGWKKMKPELKDCTALIIVVSTTGNGDAPENTERFWRFLKRRTQPKNLFEGLRFALLGLGDTNYDKFCYMGKSVDKRLRELGATVFYGSAFADEATNMEGTVEPWLAGLYPALVKTISSVHEIVDSVELRAEAASTPHASKGEDGSGRNVSSTESSMGPFEASSNGEGCAKEGTGRDTTALAPGQGDMLVPGNIVEGPTDASRQATDERRRNTSHGQKHSSECAPRTAQTGDKRANADDDNVSSDVAENGVNGAGANVEKRLSALKIDAANGSESHQDIGASSLVRDEGTTAPPYLQNADHPNVPQARWSPGVASGIRRLESMLEPRHLEAGYRPARYGLPKLRPSAPDVVFPNLTSDAGGGTKSGEAWLERARRRSSSVEEAHTFDRPFRSRVKSAKYLTQGGRQAERRVILLELSLEGSGIKYEPGDAVGIRCPNRSSDVAFLLRRLEGSLPLGATADTPFHHSVRSLPSPCTLRDAMTNRLDIGAVLRKPVLRALADTCADERDKALMELLCSKTEGANLYAGFVAAQCLTLCELLEAFPSCRPKLGGLLALLPPLPPRYYSVASSQLSTAHSLSLAFSVVTHELPLSAISSSQSQVSGSVVRRLGLCTNWLEEMLEPFLTETKTEGYEFIVPIFMKPTKEFHLPGSQKWPCVLIGPGTGVAPFIAFLQHRREQSSLRREMLDAVCSGFWRGGYEISLEGEEDETDAYRDREGRGDLWLFFGCRHRNQDWIFKEEMDAMVADRTLARISTAFSRDPPTKVYVQDRIAEASAELSQLMLKQGAYVYVCGDGNAMAQGVHKALVQALVQHGGLGGEEKAEAALKDMKDRHRYVLDVWS